MGHPLVVFGDDWGRHVSTMQHMLRHLFSDHPTIWVNGIGHRVPRMSDAGRAWNKLRDIARGPVSSVIDVGSTPVVDTSSAAPLRIIHPRVLPWHHWPGVEQFNSRSLTRDITSALRQCGLGRPVIITGSPPSVSVFGKLDEVATIYICMDDWAHLPTVSPAMLLPLEQRLLHRADAVVATARALTQSKVPQSGRVHYLPQGVNFEHFSAARPLPHDIEHLPRPWIGFAGGVGPAVDPEIIHGLAREFPHGSIILVGPEQDGLARLAGSNIHRMGSRPYAVLPAYVQAFDVGIIPYVRNPWTEAVDPLKLLEYLAAGIPVVTTDLPEIRKYADSVQIAADVRTFVAAVRAALTEDSESSRRARQAVALQNTWSARADEFRRVMDEVLSRSRPRHALA